MIILKKKVKTALIGIVAFAALIPTSAFATGETTLHTKENQLPSESINSGEITPLGAGEWDTLDTVYQFYDGQYQASKVYYSGGGDFRVCTYDVSVKGARGIVEFWSDDPSGDRFIGWGNFAENTCVKADVRKYVDGSNGKAEIYVKVGNVRPATWATMKFQD